jgi:hypothetical protein
LVPRHAGWEPALAALDLLLRGELPDEPDTTAFDQLTERLEQEWTKLVEAGDAG